MDRNDNDCFLILGSVQNECSLSGQRHGFESRMRYQLHHSE